ncbi:unnamed protein product, partial [Tetraodon nigroviridis]
MSVATITARSQRLKRLVDEPPEDSARRKQARRPPQAAGTEAAWPAAGAPSPERPPSRVGPYVLLEPWEGQELYRAEHYQTEKQFTCQVLSLRSYQECLAASDRIGPHEGVCSVLDTVISQDRAYAFLSAHYGDLHTHVRRRRQLSEDETRGLFTQVLRAVSHCHQHGVILRDVKLRRFVFTDELRTKVALVGLNDCFLVPGNHDDDSLTDRHGCPAYVSPELLSSGRGSYSGRAADVWSLGVCLYTMLLGRYPFQDTEPAALFAKIRQGAFSLPAWLSPGARCLISCMLRRSPAERLKASELLVHPWLSSPSAPH